MVKQPVIATLMLVAVTSICVSECDAGLILNLSSANNLNTVVVGQTVTVSVNLAGLNPGEELNLLAASIEYNPAIFGPPTIAAGDIIPNTLNDPLDFLTSSSSGLADATFLTFGSLSTEHIVSNGTLFSFSTVAVGSGTGTFSFQFLDAGAFDPLDPLTTVSQTVTAGPNLGFQVTISAVPEPCSVLLLSIPIVGKVLCRRRSQRKVTGLRLS